MNVCVYVCMLSMYVGVLHGVDENAGRWKKDNCVGGISVRRRKHRSGGGSGEKEQRTPEISSTYVYSIPHSGVVSILLIFSFFFFPVLSSRASLIKYRFVRERGNDKSDTCMRGGC